MIRRRPEQAARARYDLIVVGGGVYGICLLLEASRRGLATLLIEQDDFGSQTSWNSLRIVHGGIRYLQSLDLPRFFESVSERRWFLRHFPDLVRPLPCLMPLYGEGLKRPVVFQAALAANSLLSLTRNRGVSPGHRLPKGTVLSREETLERFPSAPEEGLQGSALWYDAAMPDSQRLLIEMLHWACACGGTALNYVQAVGLSRSDTSISTVTAIDRTTGEQHEFAAPVVINAAGPWCREVSTRFDRDVPELFHYSLAFNVVLDREPISEAGLAVSPRSRGGRTYFLVPWKGKIMAGTYHAPCTGLREEAEVTDEMLTSYLDDLNDSISGFEVTSSDIERVHWGLLPAARPQADEIATRPVILHHGDHGGPNGLFSVSGVKFTTARLVAEQTLRKVQQHRGRDLTAPIPKTRPAPTKWPSPSSLGLARSEDGSQLAAEVAELSEHESVVQVEDLLLRRTDWGAVTLEIDSLAPWLESRIPSRDLLPISPLGRSTS